MLKQLVRKIDEQTEAIICVLTLDSSVSPVQIVVVDGVLGDEWYVVVVPVAL